MDVESNTGTYLGAGIVAEVVGGAIWLSSIGSYDSDGATLIGGILTLVGLGLIVTGITKIAKNFEVNAIAAVSTEDHLRVMRDIAIREESARVNPVEG
ncbi:hypothetical protein [Georgenia sp. Marseille-Q6866]